MDGGKHTTQSCRNLIEKNRSIERVIYLQIGTVVNEDWDNMQEIRQNLEQVREAFQNMWNFFTHKDINIAIRLKLLKCTVSPRY